MRPTKNVIMRLVAAILLLLAVWQPLGRAAVGTLIPAPWLYALDASGNPISGAKACFYIAGTSTPTTTYSDVALTTPNTNPVVADSAGRLGPIYLTPGQSYKLILQDATGTALTCNGAVVRTLDNIAAVPGTSAGVDLTGTAGEALTAGQAVYLSAGDGGKTAGLWYKADSANTYSSTINWVGIVPSSISSASAGTIRIAGQVTGLSSLTVGAKYYVGTAGALTSTAPANQRLLGQADTTSTLVITSDPPPPAVVINNALACGRLTLTTALPVTTADVTAATTLYYTPIAGCNQVTLWNGTANQIDTLTETSVAVPATTSQMYDVFAFDNAGAVNIEVLAWTNDTTRATAISLQNGYLAKAATPARRYIGSFRTTTVSGQTEDSAAKRYVWNYYNRVPRGLQKLYADTNWNYTTATVHQANANTANQLDLVVGVAEAPVSIQLTSQVLNDTGGIIVANGIGYDSTSAMLSGSGTAITAGLGINYALSAKVDAHYPAIGRHIYVGLEWSTATGVTTWYGTTGIGGAGPAGINSGLRGFYPG